MGDSQIVVQGLVLMVAGMSIVYVFLYVMILVMRLTALVVPRFNHLLPDQAPKPVQRVATAAPAVQDVPVIAIAVASAAVRNR